MGHNFFIMDKTIDRLVWERKSKNRFNRNDEKEYMRKYVKILVEQFNAFLI